jgi:hypothetical protein
MATHDEFLRLQQTATDYVARYLKPLGDYIFAHTLLAAALSFLAALVFGVLFGGWKLPRPDLLRNFRTVSRAGIRQPAADSRTSPPVRSGSDEITGAMALGIAEAIAPLAISLERISWDLAELGRSDLRSRDDVVRDTAVSPVAESVVGALSDQLRDICTLVEGAIDGLAKARREQTTRMLRSHNEIRVTLSRIEGTMSSIAAALQSGGAMQAAMDEKLEAVYASTADLGRRLASGGEDSTPRAVPNISSGRLSADIAEIVRELHEG